MSISENVAKSGTTVTIGETSYSVDLTKVPYLESYLRFQSNAGQSTMHSDIPLFAVAYDGLENGYRQYFRKLPDQLDQYHTLCETLDILCADVLQQQTVKGLFEDLREGKGSYECEYKCSVFVKGDKKKARDAAFKLLYLILRADFESDVKDSQLVYNAVLFVVEHGPFPVFNLWKFTLVHQGIDVGDDLACCGVVYFDKRDGYEAGATEPPYRFRDKPLAI